MSGAECRIIGYWLSSSDESWDQGKGAVRIYMVKRYLFGIMRDDAGGVGFGNPCSQGWLYKAPGMDPCVSQRPTVSE